LNRFFLWFEEFKLPDAATSSAKILGQRAPRARHYVDTWEPRMSFSRCLQAQKHGAIQITAKKVVNIGEVTFINW
jgi:hypothetical protein